MAKDEGSYKAQRAKLMREPDNPGTGHHLWFGDRPRNQWVFPIARHCGWSKGMGVNAKQ